MRKRWRHVKQSNIASPKPTSWIRGAGSGRATHRFDARKSEVTGILKEKNGYDLVHVQAFGGVYTPFHMELGEDVFIYIYCIYHIYIYTYYFLEYVYETPYI